jgi:hypothetical protein
MILLAIACAAPKASTSDPSTGSPVPTIPAPTGTTGTTGTTGDTGGTTSLAPATWAGDCEVDTSGAQPLPYRELLRTLGEDYDLHFDPDLELPVGPAIEVLSTEEQYTSWLSSTGLDATAVDWATELVVAGSYYVGSTCSVLLDRLEVFDVDGTPHVTMTVLDSSYACPWVCRTSTQAIWVVAVPRGARGQATACLGLGGGCGELP